MPAQSTSEGDVRRWSSVAVCVLATCLLTWSIILYSMLGSDISDLGAAEPFVVYSLVAMREGRSLYPNVVELPLAITQYSPLYYLVCDLLSAQLHPSDVTELTRHARLVSTTCWIAVAILVASVWRFGYRTGMVSALGAGCLVLICAGLFPFQARPDSLEVLLSVGSVVL